MSFEIKRTGASTFLIQNLADEMLRGARIIERITDADYRRKERNGEGAVGAHFRHNLDFVTAFLGGLGDGKIDYRRRERDRQIEENRRYAIGRFFRAIRRLRAVPAAVLDKSFLVRSETVESLWLETSALRELEFLHSHTVHHHALIAGKLRRIGAATPEDFGVAPSTRKFWTEKSAALTQQ